MVSIKSFSGRAAAGSLIAALAASGSAAGADSERDLSVSVLDVVTVTGSRIEKKLKEVPMSVSVVDQEELAKQLAVSTDILDSLNVLVPGLSVTNGTRIGCGSSIRGRPANFQINGVPTNQDLRQSSCNSMYQISPFAIERIEVVRGATALYGAGAPGGIVNLITRRASSSDVEIDGVVRVSANPEKVSDTQDYDVYFGAGQKLDRWDYYAGLAYSELGAARNPRGGFVPREELDSWSFNGSLGTAIGEEGQLRVTTTWYREERGQQYSADGTQVVGQFGPVVAIDDHPFKDQLHDQLFTLMASYDQAEVLGHRLAVTAYLQQQEFLQRANFYFANFGGNFFYASDTENDRYGMRSTLARRFDLGGSTLELEYGLDYVNNRFYRPDVDPANGGAIIGFTAPETILRTTSGFVQSALVFGRTRLSAGVRHERYRGEIGSDGYDPSLPGASVPGDIGKSDLTLYNVGAVFDFTDRLQLYGSFSQGAELTQLSRAALDLQNPALLSPEPAASDQWELGIRGGIGSVDMSLAVFYAEADRAALLQNDESCAGQPNCPLIPLRARQRFSGAEATLDWAVTERFGAGGVFTYQRGEIYDEAFGGYIDFSLYTMSPTRLTGYLTFEPIDGWSNRLQGTYFAEADYYSPNEQALGYVNSKSVFFVDLSSSWRTGPGEIMFSVSNLLDKEYVNVVNQSFGDFGYYLEEGRRVSVGYRTRF
jgi:iron complex outermembrane receptor protein